MLNEELLKEALDDLEREHQRLTEELRSAVPLMDRRRALIKARDAMLALLDTYEKTQAGAALFAGVTRC